MILFKWCKTCDRVTEHKRVRAFFYDKTVELCTAKGCRIEPDWPMPESYSAEAEVLEHLQIYQKLLTQSRM